MPKKPMFTVCSYCGRVKKNGKDQEIYYTKEEQELLRDHLDFSHGFCELHYKMELEKLESYKRRNQ